MAGVVNAVDEDVKRIEGTQRGQEASSKHIRYTEEQVEVLEKFFDVCPNPNCSERLQLLREQPILRGIDGKQLRVWFQNRRCREKQRKESDELQEVNSHLKAANKLLCAENDSLQDKVARLIYENESLQNELQSLISTNATNDQRFDADTSAAELSLTVAENQRFLEKYNPATNSSEANPVVANSVDGNTWMELPMYPDLFHTPLHVNEPNASMGRTITPDLPEIIKDLIESNQYDWLFTTQEPAFGATNFTEEDPSKEVLSNAPNFTEAGRANRHTANLEWTYEGMSFIGGNSGPDNTAVNSDGATLTLGSTVAPGVAYSVDLANRMCQSYRSILGVDMIGVNGQDSNSLFELVQHHEYAILCFSFTTLPVCVYANLSGLRMFETTIEDVPSLSLDKITSVPSLTTVLSTVIKQGYATMSLGFCQTKMNRYVMYDKCVVWKVHCPDGSLHCVALAFIDWFFM